MARSLEAIADRSLPLPERLAALSQAGWASARENDFSGSDRDEELSMDTAQEVLEDEALIAAAIAADLGWALVALAALGRDDAIWRATKRVLLSHLDRAGEGGVAFASLCFELGEPDELARGAAAVAACFPPPGPERQLWLVLAAGWLAAEATGPALAAAISAEGVAEAVSAALDGSDVLSGAEVEAAHARLSADRGDAPG